MLFILNPNFYEPIMRSAAIKTDSETVFLHVIQAWTDQGWLNMSWNEQSRSQISMTDNGNYVQRLQTHGVFR